VTDAFKPDEVPGASTPVGMGLVSQSTPAPDGTTPAAAPASGNGGIDMSLGGLY